jgi:hypothetical protein
MPTTSSIFSPLVRRMKARAGFGSQRRGALDALESDVILGAGVDRVLRRADEGALRELQLDVELVAP